MDFELVEIFEAYNVHNAGGFIASEELNSLFVASREPNPDTERLGDALIKV